jgi:hypothetical protein
MRLDAGAGRRSVRCAPVSFRNYDPHADTIVLPRDELAVRRERKRAGGLTPSQLKRLLVAAELRKKTLEHERDE